MKLGGMVAALLVVMAMVVPVVVVPAMAHADGYYGGMGAGAGAELSGGIAEVFDTSGQVSGRIVAGKRMGPWAVEGAMYGTDMTMRGGDEFESYSTFALGGELKYYLPLTSRLELYVKGGLNHTYVAGIGPGEYDGRSYSYGTGLQYAWRPLPGLQVGAWLDLNKQVVRLHPDDGAAAPASGTTLDGTLQMVTFGFSIGTTL